MIRVHEHAPPPPVDLLDRARRIAPATIGHLREIGFVDTGIAPLVTPVSVVGPALTARMVAPNGGAVHMAIDTGGDHGGHHRRCRHRCPRHPADAVPGVLPRSIRPDGEGRVHRR